MNINNVFLGAGCLKYVPPAGSQAGQKEKTPEILLINNYKLFVRAKLFTKKGQTDIDYMLDPWN